MSETVLLTKSSRYIDWSEKEYEGTPYVQSLDNKRIAYEIKAKYVELTWVRSVGGSGPHQWESTLDYVNRRLRGQAEKKDVRNLAAILNVLSAQYGRR